MQETGELALVSWMARRPHQQFIMPSVHVINAAHIPRAADAAPFRYWSINIRHPSS